jgi:hypothetical protein
MAFEGTRTVVSFDMYNTRTATDGSPQNDREQRAIASCAASPAKRSRHTFLRGHDANWRD